MTFGRATRSVFRLAILVAAGALAVISIDRAPLPRDQAELNRLVITCEEAAARLDGCCAALDPRDIDCEYQEGHHCPRGSACCTEVEPILPDISADDAECLLDLGCDTIIAFGYCEVVEEAETAGVEADWTCLP